jgi:hypothetical protein
MMRSRSSNPVGAPNPPMPSTVAIHHSRLLERLNPSHALLACRRGGWRVREIQSDRNACEHAQNQQGARGSETDAPKPDGSLVCGIEMIHVQSHR